MAVLTLIAEPIRAQAAHEHAGFICGTDHDAHTAGSALTDIDDGPVVRALLVFVKFRDDTRAGVADWPLYADPTRLPINALVVVQGTSQVLSNGGVGVYATAGARLFVTDNALVRLNTVGGIYLNGYGTRADIDGGARINDNPNIGVAAVNQAHARIRAVGAATAATATSVSDNSGGPTALASGSVDGGQCTGVGSDVLRPNRFANNHLGGYYDARAEGGSTVAARYAWWAGRTALTVVKDKSSTVSVFPVAPSAEASDPSCQSISEARGTDVPAAARTVLADGGEGSPVAARGGPLTGAVVALASEAREAAWGGDPDRAFARLTQAASASLTEDDREAVYGAVGALVAEADSALSVPALVAALETTASAAGPDQPWAQRALGVAYAVTRRAAQADGVAAGLVTARAGTDHATFAHGLRVRLAVEADSLEMAVERLAAFAATVAPADTFAVETYASSLALVVASFPGADLSVVAGGVAGRVASAGAGMRSTSAGGRDAAKAGPFAFADEVAVYPNPSAGRGTIRVSVSEPAAGVVVSLYDALGRRVAVLHDGPLTTGAHEFAFEASRLAPGVYVVRVRVSSESGGTWTEARRVLVAR